MHVTVRPYPALKNTQIEYRISDPSKVEIVLYNREGKRVDTLMKAFCPDGMHIYQWDNAHTPKGLYYLHIHSQGRQRVKRIEIE